MIEKEFIERAIGLPNSAKISALSSYTLFLDKYNILSKIKSEDWDFFLTIAGIFVGVSQLNHENISEKSKDIMLDEISKEAIKLYSNAIEACDDCTTFVDHTYDSLVKENVYKNDKQFLFSDSLGSWIVWNLFRHKPSAIEGRELIRVLGGLVVHSFVSWWK